MEGFAGEVEWCENMTFKENNTAQYNVPPQKQKTKQEEQNESV